MNPRRNTMLGVLAAVALAVGIVGTTVSVSQNGQPTANEVREPIVEVQAVETADIMAE
jgi:hypothetical protein